MPDPTQRPDLDEFEAKRSRSVALFPKEVDSLLAYARRLEERVRSVEQENEKLWNSRTTAESDFATLRESCDLADAELARLDTALATLREAVWLRLEARTFMQQIDRDQRLRSLVEGKP